jgi:hypothetical protein
MRKPTVLIKCVANTYTGDNERVIEVSDREGGNRGCLISIRRTADGKLIVMPYRGETDSSVVLRFGGIDTPIPN